MTRIKITAAELGCPFCRREVDHTALGKDLRTERERYGMSQKALAYEMGFTPPFVCDLELGRRRWTGRLVEQYLAALRGTKA